ncbi:MAG TPA: acetate--CoA ligase family protein [Candidatus Saccharimonadales bacterium]|nr:acetate--CoA ligase family protein [Candidatus Saccharimonadales bacterium]
MEVEISKACKLNNINLLGPNCMGFANNTLKLNATFGKSVSLLGKLRFISQSGALASSLFDWFETNQIGINQFVTIGNKAVLNECDILDYWFNEELKTESEPIGMYLESISDGKRFIELASKISKNHPMFILKPGKSEQSQNAMRSHTGSIAGEDAVLEAALASCGVIRCHDIEELFNLCGAFSKLTAPKSASVAIVSNAGGPAVITSDAVSEFGLELASFDDKTHKILADNLPRESNILDPIDVLGDALADRYKIAIDTVLSQDSVSSLVVILTPQVMSEIEKTAQTIVELSQKYKKPVVCSFIGGKVSTDANQILTKNNVMAFNYPESAVKTLSLMFKWRKWSNLSVSNLAAASFAIPVDSVDQTINLIRQAKNDNRKTLTAAEITNLLTLWKFETPPAKNVSTIEEATEFTNSVGWPVVLKTATQMLHKTDLGGIEKNIYSHEHLENAFKKIAVLGGVFIQKQITEGVEVIVGTKTDTVFGKVLLFGVGGTFVEFISDKNLLVLPASHEDIENLVKNSKAFKLLNGYRHSDVVNFGKLHELIRKVAVVAEQISEIQEFEVNPVISTANNAWAIDAKVVL